MPDMSWQWMHPAPFPHSHGARPMRLRLTCHAFNITRSNLIPGHSLCDRLGRGYDSHGRETQLVLRFTLSA